MSGDRRPVEISTLNFGSVTVEVGLLRFPARPTSLETASLLPDLLARRTGESRSLWSIAHDRQGTPFALRQGRRQALSVSISRTFGWAAACVSPLPVGIDIEHVAPHAADAALAAEFFAPEERAYLAQCPPANRAASFFQIWTLKEAYLKALGSGFRTALPSFSVAGADTLPRLRPVAGGSRAYRLHSLVLQGDHALSIAAALPPGQTP